jgi:hypothetical protein
VRASRRMTSWLTSGHAARASSAADVASLYFFCSEPLPMIDCVTVGEPV